MPKAIKRVESNGQTVNVHEALPATVVDRIRCEGKVLHILDLMPDPLNCRLHGDKNMKAIKASLSTFGQMSALVVREQNMTVMKGNGTLRAATELGWTRLACSVIPMSDVEAASYGIADNRTAELAEWDHEALQKQEALIRESEEFAASGMIGWTEGELLALQMMDFTRVERDPDVIPPAPYVAVTDVGDMWLLGEHKLLCGDSTVGENAQRLMDGSKASLLITDPPYGVSFVRGQFISDPWRTPNGRPMRIVGDERKAQEQADFITQCFTVGKSVCRGGASVYMFSAPMLEGCYSAIGLVAAGLHLQSQLIWNKSNFVIGQADHHWKHELIWYGWYEGGSHKWFGGRDKSTIIDCKKMASTFHPNEKPVELITRMIEHSSMPGDLCYEPFCGSGTMLIAAQQTGRRCTAIELDPMYVDTSLRRWCDFTGQDAIRESDGASFRELTALTAKETS